MSEFKIGDVVILKSGGPRMTVVNAKDGNVKCRWYMGPDYGREEFNAEMLMTPPPSEASVEELREASAQFRTTEVR